MRNIHHSHAVRNNNRNNNNKQQKEKPPTQQAVVAPNISTRNGFQALALYNQPIDLSKDTGQFLAASYDASLRCYASFRSNNKETAPKSQK